MNDNNAKDSLMKFRGRQRDDSYPKVSIITVIYNQGAALKRLIKEVHKQTYLSKEHIIVDGGSTDGTPEFLATNKGEIDYCISEADAGIYDAMNKGIDASRGEWIYFLGADDTFFNQDTLAAVFRESLIPDGTAMLLGNVIRADGSIFKNHYGRRLYFKNTLHHQGIFYRRWIFDRFRYGAISPGERRRNYQISGDYQLNLLLWRTGVKYVYLKMPVARCGDGISMQGKLRGYLEEIRIRHEQIGFFPAALLDALTLLRFGYIRLKRSIAS